MRRRIRVDAYLAKQSASPPPGKGIRMTLAVASSPALAHRMKRLGHLDLAGGGQVVVQGDHAFVGHMEAPYGTTILDVSNPARPRIIAEIRLEDRHEHSHKV